MIKHCLVSAFSKIGWKIQNYWQYQRYWLLVKCIHLSKQNKLNENICSKKLCHLSVIDCSLKVYFWCWGVLISISWVSLSTGFRSCLPDAWGFRRRMLCLALSKWGEAGKRESALTKIFSLFNMRSRFLSAKYVSKDRWKYDPMWFNDIWWILRVICEALYWF